MVWCEGVGGTPPIPMHLQQGEGCHPTGRTDAQIDAFPGAGFSTLPFFRERSPDSTSPRAAPSLWDGTVFHHVPEPTSCPQPPSPGTTAPVCAAADSSLPRAGSCQDQDLPHSGLCFPSGFAQSRSNKRSHKRGLHFPERGM